MGDPLKRFLRATELLEIGEAAKELSVRDISADVAPLIAALKDPLEDRRRFAVYALGFSRRDGRVAPALIRVLLDRQESPSVRAEAAECLGYQGRRKALKALIRCSGADESAEVRFWCVFALGQYRRRRNKPRRAVVQALEARLDDTESPDQRGNYWAIWLEALAMLGQRPSRSEPSALFRETMLTALRDPLAHPELWRWARWYSDTSDAEFRGLLNQAEQTVRAAGHDPERFGRGQ